MRARPLVKICGMTRLEDVEAAVMLGADAVGFIFWPGSPRFVEPAAARQMVAALPPFVTPVGVFVNQDVAHINGVAVQVGLGAIQLHGDEDPPVAESLTRPVIKGISTREAVGAADRWPPRVTLLVDAHDPVRRGGTGATADWTMAAALAGQRRVLLAGGLTPDNVAEALSRVRPFGIDVSSGVEEAPGVKSHSRMVALFKALTAAKTGVAE
jgi:phosphoribosylanthranilate isomerase